MDLSLFHIPIAPKGAMGIWERSQPIVPIGKKRRGELCSPPQGPKKGGPREGEAQNQKSQNPTRAKKMEKKININEKTFKIEGN
jgi:hypothetical protein